MYLWTLLNARARANQQLSLACLHPRFLIRVTALDLSEYAEDAFCWVSFLAVELVCWPINAAHLPGAARWGP
jgi:hypothetical protein